MGTPHNEAQAGDIAKTVLMPEFITDAGYLLWEVAWECLQWEYIHMNYIMYMMWIIL